MNETFDLMGYRHAPMIYDQVTGILKHDIDYLKGTIHIKETNVAVLHYTYTDLHWIVYKPNNKGKMAVCIQFEGKYYLLVQSPRTLDRIFSFLQVESIKGQINRSKIKRWHIRYPQNNEKIEDWLKDESASIYSHHDFTCMLTWYLNNLWLYDGLGVSPTNKILSFLRETKIKSEQKKITNLNNNNNNTFKYFNRDLHIWQKQMRIVNNYFKTYFSFPSTYYNYDDKNNYDGLASVRRNREDDYGVAYNYRELNNNYFHNLICDKYGNNIRINKNKPKSYDYVKVPQNYQYSSTKEQLKELVNQDRRTWVTNILAVNQEYRAKIRIVPSGSEERICLQYDRKGSINSRSLGFSSNAFRQAKYNDQVFESYNNFFQKILNGVKSFKNLQYNKTIAPLPSNYYYSSTKEQLKNFYQDREEFNEILTRRNWNNKMKKVHQELSNIIKSHKIFNKQYVQYTLMYHMNCNQCIDGNAFCDRILDGTISYDIIRNFITGHETPKILPKNYIYTHTKEQLHEMYTKNKIYETITTYIDF